MPEAGGDYLYLSRGLSPGGYLSRVRRDPAGADRGIPRAVSVCHIRVLHFLSIDRRRAHPTARQAARPTSPVSSLGISLDDNRIRSIGFCDLGEFVAGTTGSLVHRTGDHPARRAVLLSLAQARHGVCFGRVCYLNNDVFRSRMLDPADRRQTGEVVRTFTLAKHPPPGG
jgi:hypothetical protein